MKLIGQTGENDVIDDYSGNTKITLRKHAYSNILKILQPKAGKVSDKKF